MHAKIVVANAMQDGHMKVSDMILPWCTYTDPEVMDRLKNYGKLYFKGKSEKRAVVGITGMKKILMSIIRQHANLACFSLICFCLFTMVFAS